MIKFADHMYGEQEQQALLAVTKQRQLTNGPHVRLFAEVFSNYIGAGGEYDCIPVSSCMAALHISCMALGLKPGDEVIVPAMTHTATAHAVEAVGATPVFIDCQSTGNVSPYDYSAYITNKTRAIMVLHYLGNMVDMLHVQKVCRDYGLYLIEDCALALGSCNEEGEHAGTFGDFGTFSFYPCKAITTGEGGMVVCGKQHTDKVRKLMQFGKVDGEPYGIESFGLNYRMDEFSAALGVVQLQRFVKEHWLERRRCNASYLASGLKTSGLTVIKGSYATSVLFQSQFSRNWINNKLKEQGVETSIYYPQPVPSFEYYRNKYGYAPVRYPQASNISDTAITLPVGPHLDEADMAFMANIIMKEIGLGSE